MAARGAPLRVVLPAFVAARVVTFLAMVVSTRPQGGGLSWSVLRAGLVHWDAVSYIDIAAHAYPASLDYRDAFLPGFPLLVRAFSVVTGDLVLAAVVVSGLAELVALLVIHELVRRERDATVARFAVWAIACAPLGFVLVGVYTESTFIAAAAAALLLARAGRTRDAALAAMVAVAVRTTGLALLAALVVELATRRRLVSRDACWLALVPLPLALFAGYLQLRTGDALGFLHAQSLPSFGEAPAWPWNGFGTTWATAASSSDPANTAVFVRELVAGLLGAVAVAAGWIDRRVPHSITAYCTLAWLMAVSLTFWRSEARYDLALFPLVLVLADVTSPVRFLRPILVGAGVAVLWWGAAVFTRGGWIG